MPEQDAVRDVFSHLAHIGKAVNEHILKVYDPDAGRKTTAYNRLIQRNKHLFGTAFDFAQVSIFEGTLRNPGVSGATATPTQITVSWNAALGDATDHAVIIAYNEDADVFLSAMPRPERTPEKNFTSISFLPSLILTARGMSPQGPHILPLM